MDPKIVAKLRRLLWQSTLFQPNDDNDDDVVFLKPKAATQTRSDGSP